MWSQEMFSRTPPLILAASYAALFLLEQAGGRRPKINGRRARNLLISILSFAASGLGAGLAIGAATVVTQQHWGLLQLIAAPDPARIVLGVLLLDLVDYWRHRVSHKAPILWL